MVAGDESNEMEVQKQREMRVLEAIYPRESSIPPKYDTLILWDFYFVFFFFFLASFGNALSCRGLSTTQR